MIKILQDQETHRAYTRQPQSSRLYMPVRLIWFLVLNATLSNISAISWWPILVVEEAEVPGENHQPWANNNSIEASFQVSAHLAKWFQRRRFFRTQPIRNKNCLWRPCLLTIGNKSAIFIEDLPRMLPTKFRFIWSSSYRGKASLEINQLETRIACGGHVVNRSGRNEHSL